MRTLLLLLHALRLATLNAAHVDILANFNFREYCTEEDMPATFPYYVRILGRNVEAVNVTNTHKLLFMNPFAAIATLRKLPKEKLVLFLYEPEGADAYYCNHFSKVYTYNDDLIDNKKYFKFYYPVLFPMLEDIPEFEDKKLCVLMTHRYTPMREKLIRFFETKSPLDFDYYGYRPIIPTWTYRGAITSHPLSWEKLTLLKNYRFCVCFENSYINGYITEKIFSCFSAGCVPIYYGAPNIAQYIPSNCYIDYRDFASDEDLYHYLIDMPESTYNQYLENIRHYLKSEQAHPFSLSHFLDTLYQAMI